MMNLVLQTVTASQAVDSAKPITVQTVHKGRVWLLLGGGSALLFGATIVVENNESFFPAIARANKAMRRSREAKEVQLLRLKHTLQICLSLLCTPL